MKRLDNNKYSKKEALSTLSRICSKKEICSSEALRKLNDWGIPAKESKEIINYLVKEKFIDDERYAFHFASDKFRFDKWGKYKVAGALKMKRIPENIINNALDSLPEDDYKTLLKNELIKKLHSLPKSSSYELKGKLYRFAASRGFENDLILDILNELIKT